MLPRPVEDNVRKRDAIRQGIISNCGCTNNCIKLRINAADKASVKQDNAIVEAYGNKFVIPLDFEMLTMLHHPITEQGSETDYVAKLRSTITTELSNPWWHHQRSQMLSMESQISP